MSDDAEERMSEANPDPRNALDAMALYLDEEARSHASAGHDHASHDQMMESVREATYGAHHIMVRTTYQIEVDGKPVQGHILLSNDGSVQYHGLPNYSFASAVDLVKQLIDAYPDDFPAPARGRRRRGAAPEPTRRPHHTEEA